MRHCRSVVWLILCQYVTVSVKTGIITLWLTAGAPSEFFFFPDGNQPGLASSAGTICQSVYGSFFKSVNTATHMKNVVS